MRPLPFPESFQSDFPEALLSQAAAPLGLRYRMWPYSVAGAKGVAAEPRRVALHEVLTEEEAAALRIPPVHELKERLADEADHDALQLLEKRFGAPLDLRSFRADGVAEQRVAQLAKELSAEPKRNQAVALFLACLEHPRSIVRLAAAAAYGQLCQKIGVVREILEGGLFDASPLAREIAAVALALLVPDHPALAILSRPRPSPFGGPPARTSMLVHGTFARTATWWQPQSGFNFHSYLKGQVWSDLYAATDRFDWSGVYSDPARDLGAQDLAAWVSQRGMQGVRLMGHSHGANVMLRATHFGLHSDKMVLLSCPVHWPKYEPDWQNVTEVVSVRVKADLVIMIDGGAQRFTDPRIRENVLNLWFDHSATHEPDVWYWYGVPSMI